MDTGCSFKTLITESRAISKAFQYLCEEIDSGAENMTMEQIERTKVYSTDARAHLVGFVSAIVAGTGVKTFGILKKKPIWMRFGLTALPAWLLSFSVTRMYTNYEFLHYSMSDPKSTLSRELRDIYREYAPEGSTVVDEIEFGCLQMDNRRNVHNHIANPVENPEIFEVSKQKFTERKS